MPFYVAVDFDGTCVDHRYPDVGMDVPGCVTALRAFVAAGASLILWTMRSGEGLQAAEAWFERHEIPLYGVNHNPTQGRWTQSPKAYAHVYVDDAAYGCPLRENPRAGGRPYVDWALVQDAILRRIAEH